MSVDALRRDLASLHLELPRNGLVTWTSGNISARDFQSDTMLIKPSGVTFEALTPDSLVQCNYDGRVLAGRFKPSSDTARTATSTATCPASAASSTRTAPTPPPGPPTPARSRAS